MSGKTIILSLSVAFGLLCTVCFGKYSGGTGEPNDPYLIATPDDLNSIGLHPNDWDKHFLMTADINWLEIGGPPANKIGEYIPSQPWTGTPFSGVFDGNKNQILNWCDSSDMSPCASLFGRVAGDNAIIKNLVLVNSNTNGPALVQYLEATVDNCRVESGNVFGEGGLVGDNFGSIRRSRSNVTIRGNQPGAGALARCSYGSISNCSACGNVVGNYCVGGLVAWSSGSVEDSYAICTVDGNDAVGGLVGMNKGNVSRCFSSGSVTGQRYVGGLTGDNHPGHTISDSYSFCAVSGDVRVGGLTGYNMGIILQSYAAGEVDGNDFVGAFVGREREDYQPFYWKCFWDVSINLDVNGIGNDSDPNVIGKTTTEMQQRGTFTDAGWDMVNIWDIGENQTYPFLRTHLPSDINKDNQTNFLDLAILAEHWLDDK